MTMKLFHLLLFLPIAGSAAALPEPSVKSDTLPTKASQQAKPTSRLAPAPVIMPGTRLDPRFNVLPPQSLAVGKAAPAWLRAKVSGSPMYVVNGKGATVAQMKALHQADVASVNVLEGSRAAAFYGKNARNGLVIITTKKGQAP